MPYCRSTAMDRSPAGNVVRSVGGHNNEGVKIWKGANAVRSGTTRLRIVGLAVSLDVIQRLVAPHCCSILSNNAHGQRNRTLFSFIFNHDIPPSLTRPPCKYYCRSPCLNVRELLSTFSVATTNNAEALVVE